MSLMRKAGAFHAILLKGYAPIPKFSYQYMFGFQYYKWPQAVGGF
jgi:hypothetical protein